MLVRAVLVMEILVVRSRQRDGEMLTSLFIVCARQAFVLAQQCYNEKCQRVV